MSRKKLTKERFTFKCKYCRAFLCETDGTYLFVENLEILPKVKTIRRPAPDKIVKDIICGCGGKNRIYLRRPDEVRSKEKEADAPRKFSIFRSRF